ncbi:MAG: hypothetical protein QXG00_07155 [Candidatus Woesearchaeota archaeon]
MSEKLGIQLIQIFENEWILKTDIIKSKISSLLNKNKKYMEENVRYEK